MRNTQLLRLRVTIHGAVQGVGFRPFIYRLATDMGFVGWVTNSSQGVSIEVEGSQQQLETFLLRIEREKPSRSFIQSLESLFLDPTGYTTFEIRTSDAVGEKTALVLPDIATCPDCLGDIFGAGNRRHRYPFTNCTNCGPRFSIIELLPYDRLNTTMKNFVMCDRCQAEYDNPSDRRFHAQPNACPTCGPHLELWDKDGRVLTSHDKALLEGADAIRRGAIVAVKGLGGFHLMVDARQEEAVNLLRQRKRREEKPFALMYSSLESVKRDCEVLELEERLLCSPESPIILLRRRPDSKNIAHAVAPGNPYLGVMLPYTPLHHLLMAELRFPVVATSGNLSDEPICTDEYEALERLAGIAEIFLVHNRPIARHVDDSIVRLVMGRELLLRRARGYAPLPVPLRESLPSLVAVGAHLKNTIAISIDKEVFISQHIGDLETVQAFDAFRRVITSFKDMYDHHPATLACDAHPDYLSSQFAMRYGLPLISVQHHYAHVLSCMAENELDGPLLGVSWDGTGYGLDSTIWGGEFLQITETSFLRVAHFRTFRLPGGEQAIKEPKRTAIGLLYEIFGDALFAMKDLAPVQAFSPQKLEILHVMLKREINTPLTSSVGRLFDAVAAIIGLRQKMRFEGQAAMELEFVLDGVETDETYQLRIERRGIDERRETRDERRETKREEVGTLDSGLWTLDSSQFSTPIIVNWEPMIREILDDLRLQIPSGAISAKFHNTLVEAIVAVAKYVGEKRVVLTGGCFQNKYLTERVIDRLRSENFRPYWHQRIPPNDGGIALGQIIAASRSLKKEETFTKEGENVPGRSGENYRHY